MEDCLENSFPFTYQGVNYILLERTFPKRWLCEKMIITNDKNGEEYLADNYRYLEVFDFGNELYFKSKSE